VCWVAFPPLALAAAALVVTGQLRAKVPVAV